MPSATARRMFEDQIPSFMSVFDLDVEVMTDRDTVTLVDTALVEMDPKASIITNHPQQPHFGAAPIPSVIRPHDDSTSTQMSESADSSPTTTLSTTDSSPLSDPSPSSSPDSPVNLIPLNNYPSTTFGYQSSHGAMLSIPETATLERPMTSPAPRRPRNMKGLSIQPPGSLTTASRTLSGEPCSPSFIKPKIAAMKRKPSQLSLKTSTSDLVSNAALEVPASPAIPPILHRRALKHSTSSPHMLTGLKSCTFGPQGGMGFPQVLERNESGLSKVLRPMKPIEDEGVEDALPHVDSPIKTQHAQRNDDEPCNTSAVNEDQKSPGYTEGPIAIYDDNVFLYMEPTAEEASRFDVVINVAREVRNPFVNLSLGNDSQPKATDDSPYPDTGVTATSYATAFEFPPASESAAKESSSASPTTPRPCSSKTPEYIHVPWDHNTNIAPDLMRLCETIDSRTREGKKVLIHCQQGASRSASLIIAYGLYQNPQLSLNDAYYAAQTKSRWISPNMKLMYSLQDFHKELAKKRAPGASAFRPRLSRSPTKHRLTLSVDAIELASKEPKTAPLPGENNCDNGDTGHIAQRARGQSTSGTPTASLGPSSAPLSCPWRGDGREKTSRPLGSFKVDDSHQTAKSPDEARISAHHKEPQREALACTVNTADDLHFKPQAPPNLGSLEMQETKSAHNSREQVVKVAPTYPEALMSPRAETMTSNPLHGFSHVAGLRFVDTPPTPTALFSPREAVFTRDPFSFFGRATNGFSRPPPVADPRSPPTRGEAPIIRSIDDIL
ncbi:hypothetical protein HIM_01707 [Hirsutella minnesotensis 3608]|nr:hypothetical protein HIM_01707 [Hirsutella minnesotensis 3608]